MQNILDDLYYGRISPWERRPRKMDELREINRELEDERQYFMQKMSPGDCERLEDMDKLYTQSYVLEQADAFACGFQLGAQLILAAFTETR